MNITIQLTPWDEPGTIDGVRYFKNLDFYSIRFYDQTLILSASQFEAFREMLSATELYKEEED